MGRKYSTGSSPLTSFSSRTLTYLPFYIAPLSVAPPLTIPLLPPLPLFPAPEGKVKLPLRSFLNDPDIPTHLNRSFGNYSSPDISFAPSSLALSCSWEVLQDLGSHQGFVLGSVLFSFFIKNLPASLSSSVSCSLYADDLAIWSSSPRFSLR